MVRLGGRVVRASWVGWKRVHSWASARLAASRTALS